MSKLLTQGQEIAVLTSTLGHTIKELAALRAENERLTATVEAATGECIVDLPAPESDNARLLLANKAIGRENERLTVNLSMWESAYKAVDEMNDELVAAIDRNINNALTIANYTDDKIAGEMALNIVNDLGKAYGIINSNDA